MSLKSKVESLISAGNETTGQSKTDLTSVVQDLVDGYGQGGGGVTVESLSVTQNGTYTAPSGKAYSPISVNVPNSYSASDEGKVVSNGALVAQGSQTITENGTYDTTLVDDVTVNVSGGTFTGDDFYDRYVSTEKLEITRSFDIDGFSLGKKCQASIVCLWNATGGSMYGSQYGFAGKIRIFVLPKVTRISYNFISGSTLTTIDLGAVTRIESQAFKSNSALNIVIIRTPSLVPLLNANTFQNTPFASGGKGGTLYVPSALISSYQSATNWSTILGYANNQILPIEGSIYETQYADGTPIS